VITFRVLIYYSDRVPVAYARRDALNILTILRSHDTFCFFLFFKHIKLFNQTSSVIFKKKSEQFLDAENLKYFYH